MNKDQLNDWISQMFLSLICWIFTCYFSLLILKEWSLLISIKFILFIYLSFRYLFLFYRLTIKFICFSFISFSCYCSCFITVKNNIFIHFSSYSLLIYCKLCNILSNSYVLYKSLVYAIRYSYGSIIMVYYTFFMFSLSPLYLGIISS